MHQLCELREFLAVFIIQCYESKMTAISDDQRKRNLQKKPVAKRRGLQEENTIQKIQKNSREGRQNAERNTGEEFGYKLGKDIE